MPKNAEIYHCKNCGFLCSKKSNYEKHLSTLKHFRLTNPNKKMPKNAVPYIVCVCGKQYKHLSTMSKHKKDCSFFKQPVIEKDSIVCSEVVSNDLLTGKNMRIKLETNDLESTEIIELMKMQIIENQEMMKIIKEQQKQIIKLSNEKVTTNITQHNNHTSNKFNLNIFLNEKCKDALNLMEFVNSLELQLKDLENTGKIGYVEGISKIFIDGLKELDIYKRPIHCSDLKRETLYIKDENTWEKDDKDKSKLKQAIKIVGTKNIKQIPEWIAQNPQCKDIASKKNDEYMQLVSNAMIGDSIEEQTKNVNQIIKNVTKEVIIEKVF